jgi:hypothetical protein
MQIPNRKKPNPRIIEISKNLGTINRAIAR